MSERVEKRWNGTATSKRMLSTIVFRSISWQFRDVVAAFFCVRVCGANMIHRESICANGESAWWKFHFRFGISLVWFFFARLYLLWNCCHFANSCAYLIRFMRKKQFSKSPNDVKCGELKFIYFKARTLIVEVRVQANAHTSDARFCRWIKYNLIYANHYYHCDNVL